MKTLLILHGWGGVSEEHWQSVLAEKMADEGWQILMPTLPEPDFPNKEAWLSELEEFLWGVQNWDEIVVLSHSLGSALWLHYASRHPEIQPRKVYLVAPTPDDCGIHEISDFFPLPELKLGAAEMVVSDNDPYISLERFNTMGNMYEIPITVLQGQGHFNVKAGYGGWPWLREQLAHLPLR